MKTALVIGGSGGIGKATVKILSENMNVCVPKSSELDVANEMSVVKGMNDILKEHKKIDVVVYTVSLPIVNKGIMYLEWVDFQNHINVQLKGFFSIVKRLLFTDNKVKFIVVLTEYCIGTPPKMLSHYVTAKYALMGFTKSMAVELVNKGFTFNMVSPGMVDTDLLKNLPDKLKEMTAYNNPMKRIAVPKDVAKVIRFLASKDSDYLNGVNIPINGGNVIV